MIPRTASRRLARKAAVNLLNQGVDVPLKQLQKLIEKTVRTELARPEIPPEVVLDTKVSTRNVAMSTAMDSFRALEDAKSDAERTTTGWRGPETLEALYRRILRLLEGNK